MATYPAGGSAYGAGSMSSDPGGRNKTRSFDTSVGETATVLAENATVNACAAAQDAVLKASRVVETRRTGLARTDESGGGVLSLAIVSGGTGYTFNIAGVVNVATTGGFGTGLTVDLTRTSGVITTVAVGNSGGRSYVVGDLITTNPPGSGSGASFRVTSVS